MGFKRAEMTAAVCGVLIVASMAGCGGAGRPKIVKVTGKVTLDGMPLSGAMVSFAPEVNAKSATAFQRPSSGFTDASGTFSLTTFMKDDGAPPGKYKVSIAKTEMIPPADGIVREDADQSGQYKWITPKAASDPNTSGFVAEVTASGLKPDSFALTSAGTQEVSGPSGTPGANDP